MNEADALRAANIATNNAFMVHLGFSAGSEFLRILELSAVLEQSKVFWINSLGIFTKIERIGSRKCSSRKIPRQNPVSYTHPRAHETSLHLVCRLLLEKNFFFNDTATTEIYTSLFVGSVRCV